MMGSNRVWAGLACGVALGLGAAIATGGGERADAASTFKVTPEQLQINQRISQAAVRRSNEALGLLGPVRPANSTDKNPVNPFSAAQRGQGWPTSALADGAVTSAKIGAGAVGTAQIANGAVGSTQLAPAVVAQLPSCPAGTQLIGGVCAETALREGGTQVSWTTAFAACLASSRRLPSNGESALIGQALGAAAFGTGNWSEDTGLNGANQTAAIVLPTGFNVQINQTDLVQYRCVTSPVGGQ